MAGQGGGVDNSSGRQVVVVTGASGGIGRATAVAFAARGDAVALLARGETGLAAAAGAVAHAGVAESSFSTGAPLMVGAGRSIR